MNSKFSKTPLSLVVVAIFLLISCANGSDDKWKNHSKNVISRMMGQKVVVSDTLQVFQMKDQESYQYDSIGKIIFCVNIDCSVCVSKFAYWQDFISTFQARYGVVPDVIAIVSGRPIGSSIEEFVSDKWKHQWIYDPEEDFIFQYEIEDDRFQAMVLNKKSEIILIGNPVHNKAMGSLYEKAYLKTYI